MKTHNLKTWPPFWEDISSGRKTFEVRRNGSRNFQIGDILILREWDPKIEKYTGKKCNVKVNYLVLGGQFGIAKNYCVMGISKLNEIC